MKNIFGKSVSTVLIGGFAIALSGCTYTPNSPNGPHEPSEVIYGDIETESAGANAPHPLPMAAKAAAKAVAIDNFTFDPPILEVPVGSTVTWTNRDDVPHTVTSVDKKFASPALDTDEKFSQTFTATGTYAYYCAVHTHMTGKIIVK